MFLQAVLPIFTHANQFLQREEPLIHVLQPQLLKMLKNILGKFLKPAILADYLRKGRLSSVLYTNSDNHVDRDKLVIGFSTKQRISQLLSNGEISENQYRKFFQAATHFFVRRHRISNEVVSFG